MDDGRVSESLAETEHRVTPFELFFDLVFVFGFTQVTTLLHEDPTWHGLARGLLALTVLWWAWASTSSPSRSSSCSSGVRAGSACASRGMPTAICTCR
jgi:hypothetical protein